MTQVPISKYFKSISSTPLRINMNEKLRKRKHTGPVSSSTPSKKDLTTSDIINLVSDNEEELPPEFLDNKSSECMNALLNVECVMSDSEMDCSLSSTKTIIYGTPQTPLKVEVTPSSKSSGSGRKRYSPYKKRMVSKRSPVKRNLAKDSFVHYSELLKVDQKDEEFKYESKDIDDKTNFLLQMINKYLNTSDLRNLLDKKSQELLSRCGHLQIPATRLVCRLYWRKHCWYKSENVSGIAKGKQAISSITITEIVQELIKYRFITSAEGRDTLSFDDCIDLLQKKQCTEICKLLSLKLPDSTKKSAINALKIYSRSKPIDTYFRTSASTSHVSNADRVLKLMRAKVGTCYRLSDLANETLNKLYLLMYLGMDYTIIREKKLEFTLINYKNRIETYPIDRTIDLDNASVVFKTQIEFERYYNAHNINEKFLSESDVTKRLEIIENVYEQYKSLSMEEMKGYKTLPAWLRRFTPAYLFIKIIEKGVDDLKRGEKYKLAVDVLTTLISQNAFRQHKKGEWYAEKALILHKYIRQYDKAGTVLLEGLQSDLPNNLKQGLVQRLILLVNQKNIKLQESIVVQLLSAVSNEPPISEKDFSAEHVYKPHMEREGKGKKVFITRAENGTTAQNAEEFCISYYVDNGLFTHGRHWEGRIVTTIFMLLFWDVIYMKLRGYSGIFLTPYQVYPLDMFYPSFYENRKEIIEERLEWIQNASTDVLIEEIRKVWETRPECEISGIDRKLGWEQVRDVCDCAGASRLASVCRRLATNYAYANSGFPDLTLWNTNTKQIKFVEVKTDSDKPSIKQLQWMHYLKSVGIDTGFCYVGVNTERNKARSKQSDLTETA